MKEVKIFVKRKISLNSGFLFFNLYVYYSIRGFIASTRASNLLTRTFNLSTRDLKLATRASSLLTIGFELITRGFELLTRALLLHV